MIVEGQLVGGVAQGLGHALTENLVYDASGQLLTSTLMDYALPTADRVPRSRSFCWTTRRARIRWA